MPLDWPRLTAYARHVADTVRSIPPSTYLQTKHNETRHGLLGLRRRIISEQVTVHLKGWILLVDRAEGWIQYESWPATGSNPATSIVRGVEKGRLLILQHDGRLISASYEVDFNNEVGGGRKNVTHEIHGESPADAEEVVSFDRLNLGGYRKARNSDRSVGREKVLLREELSWKGPTRAQHEGILTRQALSQLKSRGVYVTCLRTPE